MEFVKDLKSSAMNATKMFANFTKIAKQVGGLVTLGWCSKRTTMT
jgi:hypothetical protein